MGCKRRVGMIRFLARAKQPHRIEVVYAAVIVVGGGGVGRFALARFFGIIRGIS